MKKKENAKGEMGERVPHLYLVCQRVIFENNRVVCEMQYWFLGTDSSDVLHLFVGFQKPVVNKMWHQLIDALSMFFFVGYSFNEKAKGANGCQKTNSIFIQQFPIHN
jgi:hypothetical protein